LVVPLSGMSDSLLVERIRAVPVAPLLPLSSASHSYRSITERKTSGRYYRVGEIQISHCFVDLCIFKETA
jgi:hypothetical protein